MSVSIKFVSAGQARSWSARVRSEGTSLRDILLETGYTPYNGGANMINCYGMGTCGTCAVMVSGPGVPTQLTRREKLRLNMPPHNKWLRGKTVCVKRGSGGGSKSFTSQLRLACQCRILPGADIVIEKPPGFWGHKSPQMALPARVDDTQIHRQFDFDAIRKLKPFDPWLHGEMRSNQAGETGAVEIYRGAHWALGVRSHFLPEGLVDDDDRRYDY